MVNDTQIVFHHCPIVPLEGVPENIYLNKLGTYVNRQTLGIHSNKGGGKLGYMSISAQPSVYAKKSVSTEFPVPKIPSANVAYPSGNLTAAVILATSRSHEKKIRI